MLYKKKRSFAAAALLGKQGSCAFTRLFASLSSSIEMQKLMDNTGTLLCLTRGLSEIPRASTVPYQAK